MINQQLLDYIKHQTQQAGINNDEVKKTLISAGWQAVDIDEAFKSLTPSAQISSQPLVVTKQPVASIASATSAQTAASFGQKSEAKSSVFTGQVKAANPVSSPASVTASSQKFKLDKKVIIVVVAVVAGLLLLGGGVFAYFSYSQSPEKIAQQMFEKIFAVKSLEYAGDVEFDLEMDVSGLLGNNLSFFNGGNNSLPATATSTIKKTGSISLNFNGASDWQNSAAKGLFAFTVKVDAPTLGEFSLGSEVRTVNRNIYAKLSKAPNLMIFDLSSLENQWVNFGSVAFDDLDEEKKNFSDEEVAQIKDAFKRANIFKIVAKLPSEKIDGLNAYHYKFIVDKENLKNFLIKLDEISAEISLTVKEREDFEKEYAKFIAPEGEIWIGKDDLLPYKISLNFVIPETGDSKASGNISIVLSAKNYNKPVAVEVPAPVKTTEEIMSGFMRGLGGFDSGNTPPSPASIGLEQELGNGPSLDTSSSSPVVEPVIDPNQNLDSDNDGLNNSEEISQYKTDPNNPDTDGDGFKDGDEVKNGYNPNGSGKLLQ